VGNSYEAFIESKSQIGGNSGFKPLWMPDFLFDFQRALIDWSILKGRAAVFADCGLGKTPMQLVWAENMVRKTNKPCLLLTPCAVASQTVKEASKFDIEVNRSHDGKAGNNITVTNYEQLHKFNPEDFGSVACDESSILKSFKGVYKNEITLFMRKIQYRSLWTATAAPNDYVELGTSSEALGCMGHMDMLGKFFKNDNGNCSLGRHRGEQMKWWFKGHAELAFWKWICSWARAIRKPSDLGFKDDKFILPPLVKTQHTVKSESLADGYLLALPACGLKEQRDERRRSIKERCEKLAALCTHKEPVLICCHLNDEGDLLEEMLPDCVQVSGSDSDEAKEEKFEAFISGQSRGLVSKDKIVAWGLNFQHCWRLGTFASHSYEKYYQFVRRCYRFGQKNPVTVDMVASEGELNVLRNMQRKAAQADKMFSNLVAEMNNAVTHKTKFDGTKKEQIPSWLKIK